ncbi:bifunctional polysaccharide deacetylase/glycosyltransferase family 2 protein [Prauserella flavalba]|uniref:Bi-functional transferase/deacetylase n=1 Tax=Prauserella flavalba TaxID=1477506 RepID=A0A318LE93_9PSEU|nr:bifunctional polysaccharide deacetylase/glycosyltransferase family 2 protein [Prauserella flavalba]PXY18780.1 bi-functional transferase/deacetylase [Prauserella flavalba]
MSRRRKPAKSPRAHWLLLGLLLSGISALLTVNILVSGQLDNGESRTAGSREFVPESVYSGGSVVDPREPTVRHLPARTIALTFVDGPDPRWTPRILRVLAEHRVRATFFVTGAHAARHPELVRRILAEGHEIGNRTMTRMDLREAGDTRVQLELQATDLVLAGAAGITTNLVQLPYTTTGSLDSGAWKAMLRAGNHGRQVVVADLDSRDVRQPGAEAIVANSTPPDDRGAVLLMHDSAGVQTVTALDRLLGSLAERGWRVDSVGGAFGVSGATNPAGVLERVTGLLLGWSVQAAGWLAGALRMLLVVAGALAILRTLVVLIVTPIHVRRVRRRRLSGPTGEPVTVIVPAYNEEAGIAATVRSALESRYPAEVIVVDDGSTDRTVEVVRRLRRLHPRIRLIRGENAGKAAALNAGLAAARSEIVVMVDGDTILDRDAVGWLVAHFTDPSIGVVSGNAKVGNRKGLLGRWQHIEYVLGFNLDRRVYDVLQCMPTVPGAIGAWRRSAVLNVGGISHDTLAEDTDLTMSLERAGWRAVYEERAVAWTEAPATVGQLWKQRYRWCYGTLQAAWKHRRAVVERGAAGKLGRRGLPYLLLFQVLMQVLAPVIDIVAFFGLFTADAAELAVTWFGFLLLQLVPGVLAFKLDGERLRPLLVLPFQQLVYRQLMYLVVIQSLVTAVAGAQLPWHKLERTGLAHSGLARNR